MDIMAGNVEWIWLDALLNYIIQVYRITGTSNAMHCTPSSEQKTKHHKIDEFHALHAI